MVGGCWGGKRGTRVWSVFDEGMGWDGMGWGDSEDGGEEGKGRGFNAAGGEGVRRGNGGNGGRKGGAGDEKKMDEMIER